jgi:hypothetical protein
MNIFIIFLLSIGLLSCATKPDNKLQAATEKLHFKNWTLSRCLSEITADAALKQDALNTASSYLESSSLPIGAFSSADELVKTFLAKNYSGSIPGTFNTKKCIDLFHSEELEKLYQSLVN